MDMKSGLVVPFYDRKLISRSSLQIKMDLDPNIEAANRENERKDIDLMDEKQVKPVVDMVVAGILSVPRARKMLGIEANAERGTRNAEPLSDSHWEGDGLSASAGALCGECNPLTGSAPTATSA